jgi:hypothetical protein
MPSSTASWAATSSALAVTSRSRSIASGVADVAAHAAPTELSQPSAAAPAQDGAAARGERADEPTVDDATNPHGG